MGALLGFFGAGGLQLKALVIGAGVLLIAVLGLTTWALLERSGRLELKVEVVRLEAQTQVLSSALTRQSESIKHAADVGKQAVEDTRALLAKAESTFAKNAPLIAYINDIRRKPPPARADGKAKDCTDAIAEIRAKVQP